MSKIYIAINSRKECKQIITTLMAFGYKIWDDTEVKEYTKRVVSRYSHLIVNPSRKDISGSNIGHNSSQTYSWETDTAKIINMIDASRSIIIPNVGDYSAEVTKDGIEVGCQTISFEKFEEIAKAVKEINYENEY